LSSAIRAPNTLARSSGGVSSWESVTLARRRELHDATECEENDRDLRRLGETRERSTGPIYRKTGDQKPTLEIRVNCRAMTSHSTTAPAAIAPSAIPNCEATDLGVTARVALKMSDGARLDATGKDSWHTSEKIGVARSTAYAKETACLREPPCPTARSSKGRAARPPETRKRKAAERRKVSAST